MKYLLQLNTIENDEMMEITSSKSLSQLSWEWNNQKAVQFDNCAIASDIIDMLVPEEVSEESEKEDEAFNELEARLKEDPIEAKAKQTYLGHPISNTFNWDELPKSLRKLFLDFAKDQLEGNQ